jgi:hypothetical protein
MVIPKLSALKGGNNPTMGEAHRYKAKTITNSPEGAKLLKMIGSCLVTFLTKFFFNTNEFLNSAI